jgi:uncharacterized membrane-anchored protein
VIEKLRTIAKASDALSQVCKRLLNGRKVGTAAQALLGVPSGFCGAKEPERGSRHEVILGVR